MAQQDLLWIDAALNDSRNIPEALRTKPIWLVWKREQVNGRMTKVPYNARTGGKAASNDPSTWSSIDVALSALKSGAYSGLGIGIAEGIAAIDIDHCIDRYGNLSDMAKDIVERMDSYTETSPSGEGVRILFAAPGFQYDKARYYINNQKVGLEVYIAGCTSKYVTITGKVLHNKPIAERIEQIAGVLNAYMKRPILPKVEKSEPIPNAPTVASTPEGPTRTRTIGCIRSGISALSDTEIIQKALSAANADAFKKLWFGDASGFESQSEADLALCNHLSFWTRGDATQIDRLYRASNLYRDKWEREDYRSATIQKALSDCTNFYEPLRADSRAHTVPRAKSTSPEYVGNTLSTYQPQDYTDVGSSRVFAAFVAGKLIWTDSAGFLFWNGMVWEENANAAIGLGKVLTDRMLNEARGLLGKARQKKTMLQGDGALIDAAKPNDELKAATEEEKRAEAYLGFAIKSRSRQRVEAFVNLAKPDILVQADKLNADPFLLNTPGGMVDLRTGDTRQHDPLEYCTNITMVSPCTDGGELWWEHLRTVTDDSPDLMRFHQEAAGMALIGRVYMENLQIAVGDGSNGKSTLYNVQAMVLGLGYAGTINPEVLTTDKRNAGADFATLKGKRLVIAAELEEGKRLSTGILKRLTSTDPITAERKYYDPETFIPTHSTILYTNHMPRLGSMDNGTKRRLKIVPFDARIPSSGEKKNFTQELYEQAGGYVLQWMIEGAQKFIRNGYTLSSCPEVTEATQKYFEDNDWITPFLEECCIVESGRKCAGGALYQAYSTRAEAEGDYVRRNNDFARELERLGFRKERSKMGVVWNGIGLRADRQYSRLGSVGNSY